MGFWEDLNRKRAEARDTLAYWWANPGKGPPDDPGARGIHRGWSQMATEKLGHYLPPEAAGQVIDTAGVVNEVLAGIPNWAAGHGFYGEAGYDRGDIEANRRGIAMATTRLRQARENEAYRMEAANPGPETVEERVNRMVLEELMRRGGR